MIRPILNAAAMIGAALVFYGLWLAWPPLCLIAEGATIMFVAIKIRLNLPGDGND